MENGNDGAWVFERVNPMGVARATAWQNTLEASDFSTEARIAREAIQNSVDATPGENRTEILVWDKEISGPEMTAFRNILKLGESGSPAERLRDLGLKGGNFFERIESGKNGARLTTIEDRRTCGLGFDEGRKKNRFEELCLFLGQDSTDVDWDRGGSHGFGKTVYQESSDCHTFLVYSVFEARAETKEHHALLFGCSRFDGHSVDGTKYTGRAWFGISDQDEGGQPICVPFTDDAAHELARCLGFLERDRDDLGTSIMIFGSEIDINVFRQGVEDYWWPRIVSDQLSVVMWEGNDQLSVVMWEGNDNELPPPEPLLRSHLEPYIRCYNLVADDIPPSNGEKKPQLRARQGLRIGALALKALAPLEADERDNPEDDTLFRNTVALIRSGPRMVVQYLDTGGRQRGNFAGVFLGHKDSEEALHLSEPGAHNFWNPNSTRLKAANPTYPDLVRGIITAIKQQSRNFQKELNPAPPPAPTAGTRKLEQILASVMNGKGLGPPPPPPPGQDPFQVRIHEGRTNTENGSTITVKVEAKLRDDARMDDAVALMSLRPLAVMDDDKKRDSSSLLGLAWVTVDGEEITQDGVSPFRLNVSKQQTATVEAESNVFHRDIYADLEVVLRIAAQENGRPPSSDEMNQP